MPKAFFTNDRFGSVDPETMIQKPVDEDYAAGAMRESTGSEGSRVSVDSGLGEDHVQRDDSIVDQTATSSVIKSVDDVLRQNRNQDSMQDADPEDRNVDMTRHDGELGDPECEYIEVDTVDDDNDQDCKRSPDRVPDKPRDVISGKNNRTKAEPIRYTDPEAKTQRNNSKDLISHRIERLLHGSSPPPVSQQTNPQTRRPIITQTEGMLLNSRPIIKQTQGSLRNNRTPGHGLPRNKWPIPLGGAATFMYERPNAYEDKSLDRSTNYPELLVNYARMPLFSVPGSSGCSTKDMKCWPAVGSRTPADCPCYLPFGYAGLHQPFLDLARGRQVADAERIDLVDLFLLNGTPTRGIFQPRESRMTSLTMAELRPHVLTRSPLFQVPSRLVQFPVARTPERAAFTPRIERFQEFHSNLTKAVTPPPTNKKSSANPELKPWLLNSAEACGIQKVSNDVRENQIRKNTDPPRYKCDACTKSYSTLSGVTKHKQFHCSGRIRKEFSCQHCDKTYTSMGALKMHIRTHTLPCKCQICGKAFSRPWLLQGHIRTHTGEKPFQCTHCGRSFADRSNLRAHLQTHSDVKKYSCKHCSKTFSRMSLLVKHEENSCTGRRTTAAPLVI
ncbi:hypothetical protein LSH36_65g05004 [Paralvinella palmiformis]|uniref:C2H2-type domain-containing protein n=1 Tax=Paralvinella palmiformis TaxID=53620 RepID=A0AAD9NBN2_9ANNE|nr:hypothetical protein LSH36_65g05004 [Paralvinella palmiformis]